MPIPLALALAALACEKKAPSEAPSAEAAAPEEAAQVETPPAAAARPGPAAPPEKDLLSPAWAQFMHMTPGGRPLGAEARDVERAAAEELRAQGHALYRKKKDREAVAHYERALDHHATGRLYYEYANSLSNIDRLEDSIKAYEIALQLAFERPELALYNMACAYSRLGQAEPAYARLAQAVSRGYSAFEHIKKDPDMKFLRAQPDWQRRISDLVPDSVHYGEKDLTGRLSVESPRDPTDYIMCPDGTVVLPTSFASDDSCCPATRRGTWKLDNGDLRVRWTEVCEQLGLGERGEGSAACYDYERCGPTVCGPPRDDPEEMLMSREEVIAMLAGEEESGSSVLGFGAKLPAECSRKKD